MLIKKIESYESFEEFTKQYKYLFVNISADWCRPCMAIKPKIEKFISVINESDFIYLLLDNNIYDTDERFHKYFKISQIPYFSFIENKLIKESFVNGDFYFVSKRLLELINYTRENIKKNILDNKLD